MTIYLVCGDEQYYPWVIECDNIEDAEIKFKEDIGYQCNENIYLAEVIKVSRPTDDWN